MERLVSFNNNNNNNNKGKCSIQSRNLLSDDNYCASNEI